MAVLHNHLEAPNKPIYANSGICWWNDLLGIWLQTSDRLTVQKSTGNHGAIPCARNNQHCDLQGGQNDSGSQHFSNHPL